MRIALDEFRELLLASLSHLKRFPVDVLKLTRRSSAGSALIPDDYGIVHALIGLGKSSHRNSG